LLNGTFFSPVDIEVIKNHMLAAIEMAKEAQQLNQV